MQNGHHTDIPLTMVNSPKIHGNVFESVDSPTASYTGLLYDVSDSNSASAHSSTLGRACEVNTFTAQESG